MAATVGICAKLAVLWQAPQVAPVATGIWLAGRLIVLGSKEIPMWQSEQSPVCGCWASATLNVPAANCGRVWNPV
jgi:hypothetical protein